MKEVNKKKKNSKEDNIKKESKEIKIDTSIKKDKTKKNNNKKKAIIIGVITLLIIFLLSTFSFLYYNNLYIVKNVNVKNTRLHEIEISWDKPKNISNYAVVISKDKIDNQALDIELANNKLKSSYQVVYLNNTELLKYTNALSDTDYYISVAAYKNKDNQKIYYKSSKVVKIHTDSLNITKVNDLKAASITDTSIELTWSPFTTNKKNLDKTDIDITYTILYSVNNNPLFNVLVDNLKEPSYTVSNLKENTSYSYKVIVSANIDKSIIKSNDSNILTVTTLLTPIKNVTATSLSTSSISLNWRLYDTNRLNEKATVTYSIYTSDKLDGEYKLLKENITDTSYKEDKLSPNTTKYYYVIATVSIDTKKYTTSKSLVVSATTNKETTQSNYYYNNSTSSSSTNNNSTSNGSSIKAKKEAEARVIAKQIAASITGDTDLEKVTKAAEAVSSYYYKGVHKETGDDYYTAYGVFIKGESSCAGTTRALGMVLEEMGYTWQHKNENQWTHQWVIINMDGQVGWADGQVGWAGYGVHPMG